RSRSFGVGEERSAHSAKQRKLPRRQFGHQGAPQLCFQLLTLQFRHWHFSPFVRESDLPARTWRAALPRRLSWRQWINREAYLPEVVLDIFFQWTRQTIPKNSGHVISL